MWYRCLIVSAAVAVSLISLKASAATVFQQDFSSSSNMGDYISATPNSGQVNDISADGTLNTVAVVGDQLTFNMATGGVAGMLRSTELTTPVMPFMDLEMVFVYGATSTGTFGPGPNLQVGDYPASATNYGSGGSAADRFSDVLWRRTGSTFQLESGGGIAAALPYNTEHTLRFLLNDSGASQDYLGPDGFIYTLNHHSAALFVNGVLVVNNGTVSSGVATADLSTFRLRATDLDRTLAINSLLIQDSLPALPPPPPPIPEPTSFVLLLGFCSLLGRRTSSRSRNAGALN